MRRAAKPKRLTRDQLAEAHDDPDLLFLDPESLDCAIIGIGRRCGQADAVVYSYEKLLDAFIRDGMEPEDALEWVESQVLGSWVGQRTPIIVHVPELL